MRSKIRKPSTSRSPQKSSGAQPKRIGYSLLFRRRTVQRDCARKTILEDRRELISIFAGRVTQAITERANKRAALASLRIHRGSNATGFLQKPPMQVSHIPLRSKDIADEPRSS